MFTGLVQAMGRVTATATDGHGGRTLAIQCDTLNQFVLGESIAVNGVCLTVVRFAEHTFEFQLGPETVERSSLGDLVSGDAVNLERALRMGDPLGGHMVSGHVDAIGTVESIERDGEWTVMAFACPATLDPLMVRKGSIAVDGVSLTLVEVSPGRFTVMLIPHTLAHTTLGQRKVGQRVNLEVDLIAKHVQKLFQTLSIETR
jgi:riboflavin synthase